MDRIIAFDLWGRQAHYKKIYATTTALTYPIPVKTAVYGTVGAIIGLDKTDNRYLSHFKPGSCKIGLQIMRPLAFQRININLRAVFGSMKPNDNRKPTLMEFVHKPHYRIYFTHEDHQLLEDLRQCLEFKQCVYTPSLGLANLLASFSFVGQWEFKTTIPAGVQPIHSVIPRRRQLALDKNQTFDGGNRIMEISQYALEMDEDRNVLDRDDIILDQNGRAIFAEVKELVSLDSSQNPTNVVLF